MARGDVVIGRIAFTPADWETLLLIRAEPYSARCARLAERLCLSHNGAKKRLDHLRLQTCTSSVNELLEWVWRNSKVIDQALTGSAAPAAAPEAITRFGPGSVLSGDVETAGLPVVSPCDDRDDMDRRAFLQDAGKLTGALVATACLQSVELARSLEVSDVGPATLEQLDATVDRFRREYFSRSLPELMAEVQVWRQYVARLLEGRLTLSQRRHLYGAAGWLSCLLGSLSFDLGREQEAGAHQATAMHLAAEAGHDRLAACIGAERAFMAVSTGAPQQAVAVAQAGQKLAPDSVVAVRLLTLEARGHARMGDCAGFELTMGRAIEAFERLPEPPSGGIYSFAVADFPYLTGRSWLWLSQARRAIEQSERAIRVFDATPVEWPEARVNARLNIAIAFAQLREVDDACAVGGEALDIYRADRRSFNVVRQAAELRSALQGQKDLPAVREFNERFEVVCGEARPR